MMETAVPPMTATLTLDQGQVGDRLQVCHISDPETATVAMRLGIATGEVLELISRVPGGPVVVRRGKIEIALGRQLCRFIEVERQA